MKKTKKTKQGLVKITVTGLEYGMAISKKGLPETAVVELSADMVSVLDAMSEINADNVMGLTLQEVFDMTDEQDDFIEELADAVEAKVGEYPTRIKSASWNAQRRDFVPCIID